MISIVVLMIQNVFKSLYETISVRWAGQRQLQCPQKQDVNYPEKHFPEHLMWLKLDEYITYIWLINAILMSLSYLRNYFLVGSFCRFLPAPPAFCIKIERSIKTL